MRLSQNTLSTLAPGVAAPAYDRSAVRAGILHVGLGNFHRAHQAVYVDDLLAAGGSDEWGILGAGVMPADAEMRRGLEAQDWLYTVVEQDADGDSARVVGALTGFLPVERGHGPILAAMRDPAIRIVSLTVTEGGYFISARTGAFDLGHPSIRADIAAPETPETIFGAIVAGLRERRAAGAAPFTVMSCDNVPHNGAVTRAAVLGVAEAQDPGLAGWIAEHVAFPNGMVDRITPATTDARRSHFTETFGLEDQRPVFCEPFRQWVLEDKFTAGRPALEAAGVQFVPDVTPYENMKIRILNGGHAIIAYASGLLGVGYAHEAMTHALVAPFLDKIEREEIIPVVPPVPDTSLEEYHALIRDRFANPRIGDTISRLCFDGLNRQPKFILPSIADNLRAGGSIAGLTLANALWARYCYGVDEAGAEIGPNDPQWDRLQAQARLAKDDPLRWLELDDVYGPLAEAEPFRTAFAAALAGVWADGTEAALRAYIGAGG